MPRTAIIGGGAAGFFLAVNLKEMMPEMDVTIFERSHRVLAKVEISGGGRCNCTNSFAHVKDLSAVYPRGHRLLKRLFKGFDHRDAYAWFERHGIRLVTQADDCVFPASQDSHSIINCFLHEARRHHVSIVTGRRITSLDELHGFDYIAVTTGGSPKGSGLAWLQAAGHEIEDPVPSLFTFAIDDPALRALTGTVAPEATAFIPGMKYRSHGPLLITHWGMSGPAILKLSSHAARLLYDHDYHMPLCVNWTSRTEAEVQQALRQLASTDAQKQVGNARPFFHNGDILSERLWQYLIRKALGSRADNRWGTLSQKDLNRLTNTLCNDTYAITSRGTYKDEFVTCGGIALSSVNPSTLESRTLPHLYFAGEVLDIDGITGGFNFQAAWTTAYTVAQSIVRQEQENL